MNLLQVPLVGDSLKMTNNAAQATEKTADLIKHGQFDELFSLFLTWGIDFLSKLIVALIIFFVGRFLIRKLGYLVNRFFDKMNWEPSLENFIAQIIKILLYIALIILIVNVVGSQTVSLAALIGAAGLAIGMAVKDNLANFAGGVMLLANHPFRIGDFIQVQDISGTVKNIGILYTEIVSFEGKRIFVPNGPISTGNIINYSAEPERRLELIIGVEYGSEVNDVKHILYEIIEKHPKILKYPEPVVVLKNLNESSVDYAIRVFTKNEDYWTVNFDLNEQIYTRLNEVGIGIPFPQVTVHLSDDKNDAAEIATQKLAERPKRPSRPNTTGNMDSIEGD